MLILNECKAKGGGGRNSARRTRRAIRTARRNPLIWMRNSLAAYQPPAAQPVNLAEKWTPTVARVALKKLDESGQSQRAFAQAEGFPVGRINTWRKRLERVDNSVS